MTRCGMMKITAAACLILAVTASVADAQPRPSPRSVPERMVHERPRRIVAVVMTESREYALGAHVSVQFDGEGPFMAMRCDSASSTFVLDSAPHWSVIVRVVHARYPTVERRYVGPGPFALDKRFPNMRIMLAPAGTTFYSSVQDRIPYVADSTRIAVVLNDAAAVDTLNALIAPMGLVEDLSHDTIAERSIGRMRLRGMRPMEGPSIPPVATAGVHILRRRDGAPFSASRSWELAALRVHPAIAMAGAIVELDRASATICDHVMDVILTIAADTATVNSVLRHGGCTIISAMQYDARRWMTVAADPGEGYDIGDVAERLRGIDGVSGVMNNVRLFQERQP